MTQDSKPPKKQATEMDTNYRPTVAMWQSPNSKAVRGQVAMRYQRKSLTTRRDIGTPQELPAELVGLADESLADLSWADPSLGFRGQGFFPVEDPPPPVAAPKVTALEFKQLFTQAERIAIRDTAKVDSTIEDLLDLVNTGNNIDLGRPLTISAVNGLETAGLIGPGRAAVILTGAKPEQA